MAKDKGTGIKVAVTDDGRVVVQFEDLIREVQFEPEQATSLGVALIQWARSAESLRRVQPPGKTTAGPRRPV